MHIEKLKEKLLNLSNNCAMVRITTLDSKGYKEYYTGAIFYRPDVDERFQIFDCCSDDLMFKPEAVVRLEVMSEVWETHSPSNVINYNEDNWG